MTEYLVKPPRAAQKLALRALRIRERLPPSKRGGLSEKEAEKLGIGSGVAMAKSIAAGEMQRAGKLRSFFSRFRNHVQVARDKGLSLEESKALQAWDLWGGDPMAEKVGVKP